MIKKVIEAYKCVDEINYKTGKFNTFFILPIDRENELILKLNNRIQIEYDELGGHILTQLLDDWDDDRLKEYGALEEMREAFMNSFEINSKLSLVNELNYFSLEPTRGIAIKVDGLANLETEGRIKFIVGFFALGIVCISDETVKLQKDLVVLSHYHGDSPSNHPRFDANEIIFNSIDKKQDDSFILLVLFKVDTISKTSFGLIEVGFNVVPIFKENSFLLNGDFVIPFITQALDGDLFELASEYNPWNLQRTLIKAGSNYVTRTVVEYKQYNPELKVTQNIIQGYVLQKR